MIFSYTPEQQTFRETVRDAFSHAFPSQRLIDLATLRDENKSQTIDDAVCLEVEQLAQTLGLVEFFTSGESEEDLASFLCIVAEESGRALLPYPLYQTLVALILKQGTLLGACVSAWAGDSAVEVSHNTKQVLLFNKSKYSLSSDLGKPQSLTLDLTHKYAQVLHTKQQELGKSLLFSLAVAAEAKGIAEVVIEKTQDYLKTRKQFSVPVGGFQAVQHKLADVFLESESLKAGLEFSRWSIAHSPEQAELSVLSLLRHVRNVLSQIVEVCIQLHGGIGFTWESELHLYLRRAQSLSARLQDESADLLVMAKMR